MEVDVCRPVLPSWLLLSGGVVFLQNRQPFLTFGVCLFNLSARYAFCFVMFSVTFFVVLWGPFA